MTVEELISNPSVILEKKPFHRGCKAEDIRDEYTSAYVGSTTKAALPNRRSIPVSQDRFLQELDPMSHVVHFDETIPDIAVKNPYNKTVGWIRQKGTRISFNFQEIIRDKRVQYLCGKPTKLTLCNSKPDESVRDLYTELKEDWLNKNMDVWRYKLVRSQMSTGDGALLFYFKDKKLRNRVLSYEDGYVLLPQYDENGDMVVFGVYYKGDDEERLDVYTDTSFIRYKNGAGDDGWVLASDIVEHGFQEIPIVYKRAEVAWNSVQNSIEIYEILYNIYTVIQKRFGSSVLWIKGNYDSKTKKQGWSVILNSSSFDTNADAKILTPAEPVGTQNLLADIKKQIQLGSHVVLIQPEDIKMSGDVTGIAVKMLLSAAYEKATQEALDYDDVADKMLRLFMYGMGVERAKLTDYAKLSVRAEFEAWMPQSDTEIANIINTSLIAGSLTPETGREIHPYAKPDEVLRGEKMEQKLEEKAVATEAAKSAAQAANANKTSEE